MTRGAFHSTKTFENLETASNGTEIIQKLLNFRNVNHSIENSRNPGSKVQWKEKIGVYLARLFSFLENLENTVPFATESRRKFKPDVLVEFQSAQGKLDGPFAVRPTGPSNHICAEKKNEGNFLKFLGVKYFAFRFSEIIMFYSLIETKQKCDIPYFLDRCLFKIGLTGEEL